MKITLYGKPISTQHLYGQRGRIRYMKAEAKRLKQYYISQIKEQYKTPITEKELELKIDLYFPDKLRRDIDNWHKLTLDSMSGIVYKDDTQITKFIVEKFIDKRNPRIEILIINK